MRDLTFFNEGNQKLLSNGLINFSKLRTLVQKVCVVDRSGYLRPYASHICTCYHTIMVMSMNESEAFYI